MTTRHRQAIAALSVVFVALAGIPAPAQSPTDIAAVTAANQAFYAAVSARDLAAQEKLWAHDDCVTWIGPRSATPVSGWPAVQPMLKSLRDRYDEVSISMTDVRAHASGMLAWIVGREVGGTKQKDGSTTTINNLTTNVFERRDGGWLMVSHHTHIIPK